VSNPELESTLPTKVNFTQEEWAAFGIARLHFGDYIMSKISVQTTPQLFSERRIRVRWTLLSESSELERTTSICIRVKQICTDPTTSSLREVARYMVPYMEFLTNRLKSGKIEHTTITVTVLPNEPLPDYGNEVQSGP